MGDLFRSFRWRAGKAAGTILGAVVAGGFAAIVAFGLPCLGPCTHRDDAQTARTALASPHSDDMRREMERIHGGKVDKATMERIVAAMQAFHEHAIAHHGADGSARFQLARLQAPDFDAEAPTKPDAGQVRIVQRSEAPLDAQSAESYPDNRSYVGRQTCETCHQQEAGNWAHTLHAKVFGLNPRNSLEAQNCEACHGPGSEHVKDPADFSKIISFSHKSKTPVPRQNAQCLACHEGGQRIFWHGSIHQSNNVGCSDCHNPMTRFSVRGLIARESISETCFQCHKVQRAQFNQRSHMPLLEGKITCTDCHNPHGSTTRPLLKADSTNELCYTCHAEKRGPFLFEHAPVRENCLNCHNPHGSNFEALLTAPRPLLCQQCHSQNGHPAQLMTRGNLPGGPMPDPRLIATSCQTCHVNIHGSNHPSGSRFER